MKRTPLFGAIVGHQSIRHQPFLSLVPRHCAIQVAPRSLVVSVVEGRRKIVDRIILFYSGRVEAGEREKHGSLEFHPFLAGKRDFDAEIGGSFGNE